MEGAEVIGLVDEPAQIHGPTQERQQAGKLAPQAARVFPVLKRR